MSDQYEIKYEVTNNADGTRICIVGWSIPDFFITEHIIDLRTNKADCGDIADEDKFLLKMVRLGKEMKIIQIYFLAPARMILRYKLLCRLTFIKESECFMVQPNKWQYMTEQPKKKFDKHTDELGMLHFGFEFTIHTEIKVDHNYGPKGKLVSDLEKLFTNSILSDVTIKSAEGVEFKTHKVVLAARSDVLKAHFEHNTVESVTNVIETSLETEVLEEVLRCIYTDNTPKVKVMPEKLLAAADYYQLSILKHLCEEELFQKLTVDNAIATLVLADLHSASNLKEMTLDFICDGHGRQLLKTKGWMELQPGALTKTILEYVFSNCKIIAD